MIKLAQLRIIVTGAAGFIGSHITEALIEQGSHVIGIDNLSTGKKENIQSVIENDNFEFIEDDIGNIEKYSEKLDRIDYIFHEAAFVSVFESVQKPVLCNKINVEGTLKVLEFARQNNVKRLIFASSAAIYGDSQVLPKKEDMFTIPSSPYGVSKQAAESYVINYNELYNLETVALRYFNVYGPRQDDSAYCGVLSIFSSQILRNKSPTIFGDGEQSRDFIYVKDIVRANLMAMEADQAPGNVFNIATGKKSKLIELTNNLIRLCKKDDLTIKYEDARPGDVKDSYADISKAKKLLNFQPKYTIEEGLQEYIDFKKSEKE